MPQFERGLPPEVEMGTDKQRAAIGKVYKAAEDIVVNQSEELRELYNRIDISDTEIAKKLFGEELVAKYPEVYRAAIGEAARQIFGHDHEKIRAARFRERSREKLAATDPKVIAEGQLKGRRKSMELYGVQHAVDASLRAKGVEPWKTGEREKFFELRTLVGFQHAEGNNKGKPDYIKIAAELNRQFHNGEPVRNYKKLAHSNANAEYAKKKRII